MFKSITQRTRRSANERLGKNRKKQQGTVAIEFAALFSIFFVILYAVIAYSIPLLLSLTFKQVSSDASRATIKVDQAVPEDQYIATVAQEVSRVVESSWLPKSWVSGNCPVPQDTEDPGLVWVRLPSGSGSASYGFFAKELLNDKTKDYRYIIQVCLQRKYGSTGTENERAIIPTINILGIKIPSLPEVDGEIVIRKQTTIRL